MTQIPTEWEVFKYFMHRAAILTVFLEGIFVPLLGLAAWNSNIFGVELMGFFVFVYIPALVMGAYYFKRGEMRMRLESEPTIRAIQRVVLEALGGSPLNPANRKE
jgi:hypothetical protein